MNAASFLYRPAMANNSKPAEAYWVEAYGEQGKPYLEQFNKCAEEMTAVFSMRQQSKDCAKKGAIQPHEISVPLERAARCSARAARRKKSSTAALLSRAP